MDSGRERIIFIILAGASFLLALLMQFVASTSIIIGFIFGIVALFLATIAFVIKDYSYLIDPVMHMKGRTIVLDQNEPFYMSTTGKSIIVRSGNVVYATSFIKIPLYKSSTEMSDEEKYNFATVFSRAISISTTPMRISSQLHMVNKSEYMQVITDKLNEVEDRYNSVLADKNAAKNVVDRVKGEVNMWHNLLDTISKSNSQAQIAYATVTASGENEDQAVNFATTSAEQISAGLSASLGIPTTVANGDDILLFVKPESLIPINSGAEAMKIDNKSPI